MGKERLVNIYELIDPFTDCTRYIGKTVEKPSKRLTNHLAECRKYTYTHRTAWLRSLVDKGSRPIINVIDKVPQSEWEFWEQWYIELYKSWGIELTNQTVGGDGVHDREPNSGSFKKGQKAWNKGMTGLQTGWEKGKPKPKDAIEKMRATKKAKFASGELINPRKGYVCSEEERLQLRMIHPNRMETYQLNKDTLELVRKFDSRGQIESELGFNNSNIGVAIKKGWNAYGYRWMYKEEYEKLQTA